MSIERHMPRRNTPPSSEEIFGMRKFSEIELGLLQMQILWLLSRKSTHGYEIMKILSNIKKTKITQGTLYPTLQALEGRGLIKRHEEGRRSIYSITLRGRKVMNETCMDFSKTFFGIFQNFVCEKCVRPQDKKDELVKIGEKK
ncbi:MAG: PadR family transcriptional regulator [Candidatus Aenigmatarchaeota archaeon]